MHRLRLCSERDVSPVLAGMQWLLFELLWRDFFRFITKKYTVTGVAQRLSGKARMQQAPTTPALATAG